MVKCAPMIICRLCDKNGMILNAYKQNSIKFTELTSPENRFKQRIRSMSGSITYTTAEILIEGYVSVCIDGRNLSAPFPFRIVQRICINAPEHAVLRFTVNNFVCQAATIRNGIDFIRIKVIIETRVTATKEKMIETDEDPPALAEETIDTVRMLSETCMVHGTDRIKAEAYQYTALSDGEKRVYTNADELKEYGDKGILSPGEVSYYNLYVNGVLQPKVNYIMTEGRLEFITTDIPTEGATVIIKYITLKNKDCINITDDQYYTISDGIKREYTNNNELKKYSTNGIPGPDEVSYYNLYVNGVLQPKRNYIIKKGLLKFITTDIPQEGQPIILESIAIKDACGHLMEVEDYQYDTLADEKRVYCSGRDITPYGRGILAPQQTSYQNLLVNAVNQPSINYKVAGNCLILKTADLPPAGSPVTLQSIRVLNKNEFPDNLQSIRVFNKNEFPENLQPNGVLNNNKSPLNSWSVRALNRKYCAEPCCIFLRLLSAVLLADFGLKIF
jgi:hypothetical protein